MPPLATILMPVRNGAPYVRRAVDSVLQQTFRDFTLLVVDDASDDGTPSMLSSYSDPRIKVLRNDRNMGVAESLNLGLRESAGKYIIRMDADDECLPHRLQRLVDFMDANPGTGAAGSWVRLTGKYSEIEKRPSGAGCVKASLCLYNPVFHPSVIIRAETVRIFGLKYDGAFSRSEDYDLWSRLSDHAGIDNVPEVLLRYHVHESSVTAVAGDVMEGQSMDIMRRELLKLGLKPTEGELRFHRNVSHGNRLWSRDELVRAEEWFGRLISANAVARFHKDDDMRQAVSFAWFRLCRNSANLGPWVWRKFRSSELSGSCKVTASDLFRFAAGIAFNIIKKPVRG